MPEPEPPKERCVPVWGLFLIFLGIVFLLQTLSALPWGLWGTLWRLWPVLIIIIGINILLRHRNPWLVSALILALLFASLGVAIWQHGDTSLPSGEVTKSYSEPLDNLEHARIQINFNAGSLTISSLPSGSANFAEADSGTNLGDMRTDFQRQDGKGTLCLSTEQANWRFWDEVETRWEVSFTRNIPLTMDIKSAAGDLDLDLSELKIAELQMDLDVGNCTVKMPSVTGTTHAYIKTNVANLEITIPDEVAARLKIDTELSALDVDSRRFPRKGDYYISSNFESAQNRLELELDCDIGRVLIK